MKVTGSRKIFEEIVTLGKNGTDFVTVRTRNGVTNLEFHRHEYSLEELQKILDIAQEIDTERLITWEAMNRSEIEWPEEKRMDIIGQNGNDGDHYEKIYCDFLANNC